MARRYFINKAPLVTLSGSITASATTITVSSVTGYPASTPFTICLERSTANEEVCLVTAVNTGTNQFTVTRGYDGTTGVIHSSGVAVEHTTSAIDYTEANTHVNDTSTDVHSQYILKSVLGAKGTIVSASASSTPSAVAVGTDNYVLLAASGQTAGLAWGQVVNASIADGTIDYLKLNSTSQKMLLQSAADSSGVTTALTADGQMVYQQDTDRWYTRAVGVNQLVPYGIGRVTYGTGAAPTTSDVQNGDVYFLYV